MMVVMEPEHNDQFQIGDEVVYTPEGVITTITGYDWLQSVDASPKIVAYQLACGISAPKGLLAVYIGARHRLPLARQHLTLPPIRQAPVDAIGKDRMPSFEFHGPRCGYEPG